MKTILTALAISLVAALPAYADDAHHPDQPPAVSASTPETTVQKMRDNTTTMQSQLEALAAAKNPEERQKLLMEHMQTMRENMMLGQQMAAGQMGCPMMGDMGMMQGMGMMGPGAPSAEALAKRMHQIEQRMDRIQMRMEQTP
ncbi:hypothetical protein [Aromatoleum bremense]|uniref:DUF4175 domain-containing protein n=1 Tax=Aromatoleum bremense TaxID=76115 RepID=A0ABX1NX66_9RHOO|nr:hypothetical protein [Aromatoleum bremense]NMG16619.1 hypothetical protein [Aromatoleum bremense]QTQ31412.1 Uncharacterized protein pbN1_14200 [Aromatoleum bremense]